MKLRQNKLSPLKLDERFAQSLWLQESSSHGPLKTLFETILARLDAIRNRWFETLPNAEPTSISTIAGQIAALPTDTLTKYTTQRSQSVLTQIFELASRHQSNSDRVVFLGNAHSQSIVRCIVEACCDPYWNERTRAERGSKPRMYFAGESFDNDSHQALLELFAPQRACNRFEDFDWGVVKLTPSRPDDSVDAFASILKNLRATRATHNRFESNQIASDELPSNPIESDGTQPIDTPNIDTQPDDDLWTDCSALCYDAPCYEAPYYDYPCYDNPGNSDLPSYIRELYSPFSIVGLLPAAILGVNIMELLAGASFISKEFQLKPASENPILRWTAWNALVQTIGAPRQLHYWNNTLRGGMEWLMHLWSADRQNNLNTPEWRIVPPSNPLHSNLTSHHPMEWHCHLKVDQVRHDALDIPGADSSNATSFPTALQRQYAHQLQSLGQPSPTAPEHQVNGLIIELPILDELAIGQWMQWMMLSTLLQQELLQQELLEQELPQQG